AGIHAFVLLRHPSSPIFRKAFAITLGVAAIVSVIQPLSGHDSAHALATRQPEKLAAAEAHYHTARRAPIIVGGLPDDATREVRYGLPLPGALSLLATNSLDGEVKGLDQFPEEDWPPVLKTHLAFDVMVGAGSACALVGGLAIALALRRRAVPTDRWFLRLVAACGPLGLVAMEAGWCVTEFGRQPWIVRDALRTREAVTPFPHLAAPFWVFTLVYVLLGVSVVFLLYRQLRASPAGDEAEPMEVEHAH
ncbi:MAG: cytochrome ubiquinol oxidase subunit I, partial [Byssovorax sp.]